MQCDVLFKARGRSLRMALMYSNSSPTRERAEHMYFCIMQVGAVEIDVK